MVMSDSLAKENWDSKVIEIERGEPCSNRIGSNPRLQVDVSTVQRQHSTDIKIQPDKLSEQVASLLKPKELGIIHRKDEAD